MNKTYKANRDGEVLGTHYKKGEAVPVSEAQAKYLTAPNDDQLIEIAAKAPSKAKPSKTD